MALFRRVFASFAIAAAACLIALILIPPAVDAWVSRGTRAQIPEPSAVSCQDQTWPNADRVCLTWTAPREMDARADGRRP
jgi:hypothetical protein